MTESPASTNWVERTDLGSTLGERDGVASSICVRTALIRSLSV
jgi:hypothetical protein